MPQRNGTKDKSILRFMFKQRSIRTHIPFYSYKIPNCISHYDHFQCMSMTICVYHFIICNFTNFVYNSMEKSVSTKTDISYKI